MATSFIGNDNQLDNLSQYRSCIDRYYTKYCSHYSIDENGVCHPNYYILQHSNCICIICLGDGHPLIRNSNISTITHIDYQVSKNTNRSVNNVIGKRKKGAQKLSPYSVICYIHTSDGVKFPVYACVDGFLVEVNESVSNSLNLIVERPIEEGHIAVVMSAYKTKNDFCKNRLLKVVESTTYK